MAAHTSDSDCDLVTHDLGANHGHGLALGWINFSWHDTWSRFIFWKVKFSQSTSGSTSQESDIVGNLEKTDSDGVECTVEFNHSVFGGQRFELVWSSNERMSGLFRNCLGDSFSESNVSVETSSDSGTSLGEFWKLSYLAFHSSDGHFQLMSIAWKFLTQSDGSSVLGVSSTDFDDVGEFQRLRIKKAITFFSSSLCMAVNPGRRTLWISSTVAMCMTVGKLSFDDWLLLTSSFGWTNLEPNLPPKSWMALFEMTSLAFMLDCVPEPVCQTTNGKWSSSFPWMT